MSNTSLLPPNATPLDRAMERVMVKHLCAIPQPHRDLWNPDKCPVRLLPWLAWALGANYWNDAWSESRKRRYVKQALGSSRNLGVKKGVMQIVQALGGAVTVVEWFEKTPPGPPNTFEAYLDVGTVSPAAAAAAYSEMVNEIQRVKPVRAHFTPYQALQGEATRKLAGVGRVFVSARMKFTVQVSDA
ncbi:phage tail protein I [Leptospira sp. 96542]|nr:phage tail protein I [Leptospira sp. 96542]